MNQKDLYELLKKHNSLNFTDKQLAGIVGSAGGENDTYEANREENTTAKKKGYGIFQHTGERHKQLEDYAKKNNLPVNSADTQVQFAMHELGTTEKRAAEQIKKTQTAEDAASAAMHYFERPTGTKEKQQAINSGRVAINEAANELGRRRNAKELMRSQNEQSEQKPLKSNLPVTPVLEPKPSAEYQSEPLRERPEPLEPFGQTQNNSLNLPPMPESMTTILGQDASQMVGANIIDMNIGDTVQDMAQLPQPTVIGPSKPQKSPGFFAGLGHYLYESSVFGELNKINRFSDFKQPGDHTTDPNWDSVKSNFYRFENTDSFYHPYLADATSEQEQQNIYNFALQKAEQDKFYGKSGFVAYALGTLSGSLAWPSTPVFMLLPMGAAGRSAKITASFVETALKVAPAAAAAGVVDNAIKYGMRKSATLGDFIEDVAVETTAGMVLGGSFSAIGAATRKGLNKYTLSKNMKAVKAANLGIEATPVLNEKTGLASVKLSASPGSSVGAAEVNEWQQFYNSALAEKGIFQFGVASKVLNTLSPPAKYLNSKFKSLAYIFDRVGAHSYSTEGTVQGVARPPSVSELRRELKDKLTMDNLTIARYWREANGLTANNQLTQALKDFQIQLSKDGYIKYADFSEQVMRAKHSNIKSGNPSIDAAVEIIQNNENKMFQHYKNLEGFEDEILNPVHSANYLSHVYHHEMLTQNPEKWQQMGTRVLRGQDESIERLLMPTRTARENIDALIEQKLANPDEVAYFNLLIENEQKNLEMHQKELFNNLFKPENHILLDQVSPLNRESWATLKKLNEEINKEFVKPRQAIADKISQLKESISRAKASVKKAKTAKTVSEHADKLPQLERSLAHKEQEAVEAGKRYNDRIFEIRGEIEQGFYNRKFMYKDKDGFYKLRDHNSIKPKLRKVFFDDAERAEHMKAQAETILGHTAEDLNAAVLSHFTGGLVENPVKKRTTFIPTQELLDNGFLVKDVISNYNQYMHAIGSQTTLKEAFPELDFSPEGGGLGGLLLKEYRAKQTGIIKKYRKEIDDKIKKLESDIAAIKGNTPKKQALQDSLSKARQQKTDFVEPDAMKKELSALKKELEKSEKRLKVLMDVSLGRNDVSEAHKKLANALKDLTIATYLKNVPLTQAGDVAATLLKNKLFPIIRSGIIPVLKDLATLKKGANSEEIAGMMRGARMGFEHLVSASRHEMHNGDLVPSQFFERFSGELRNKASVGLSKLAHVSQNVSMASYIDNVIQRFIVSTNQHVIMELMHKVIDKTITSAEIERLARAGLSKEDAKPFINAYKQAGGYKDSGGGYHSMFHKWQDQNTMLKMSRALRRSVDETLLKGDKINNPFLSVVANNAYGNLIFLFKGWSFSAFSRYLGPGLQRPDANLFLGMMTMLLAGSMETPLRKLSRGEDFDYFDEGWAWDAVSNSGVTGYLMDFAQKANALSGGAFWGLGDKEKMQSALGLIGGPVPGLANDIFKTIKLLGKDEITEADHKRAMRSLPIHNNWWLNQTVEKLREAIGG